MSVDPLWGEYRGFKIERVAGNGRGDFSFVSDKMMRGDFKSTAKYYPIEERWTHKVESGYLR